MRIPMKKYRNEEDMEHCDPSEIPSQVLQELMDAMDENGAKGMNLKDNGGGPEDPMPDSMGGTKFEEMAGVDPRIAELIRKKMGRG